MFRTRRNSMHLFNAIGEPCQMRGARLV